MKRNSLLLATLFITLIAGAQSINLHMNNGMVVNYNSSEVDYIDFSESSSSPVSYTSCPDGNHPHLIDLGLPSGTKWACCNVGASSPEQYGGYYAWGETVEKSTYDWSNYILCDGMESTSHYIGTNIAGTNYDVAHVKWGDSWVMPSYSQFKELIENCTTEWTSLNGINGYKFTGPNGSSIFLPASGYYGFGDKFFEGSAGLFWSSTYNSSNKELARYLRFDSGRLTLDYYLSRNSGQPVRAIQKGTGTVPVDDPAARLAFTNAMMQNSTSCTWEGWHRRQFKDGSSWRDEGQQYAVIQFVRSSATSTSGTGVLLYFKDADKTNYKEGSRFTWAFEGNQIKLRHITHSEWYPMYAEYNTTELSVGTGSFYGHWFEKVDDRWEFNYKISDFNDWGKYSF